MMYGDIETLAATARAVVDANKQYGGRHTIGLENVLHDFYDAHGVTAPTGERFFTEGITRAQAFLTV